MGLCWDDTLYYTLRCFCVGYVMGWLCIALVMGWLNAFFLHKAKQVYTCQAQALGFSVFSVLFSCLRTKEQGIVGEHGIVGLE